MATYEPRLKTKFRAEIKKNLQTAFAYSSPMQVPELKKKNPYRKNVRIRNALNK